MVSYTVPGAIALRAFFVGGEAVADHVIFTLLTRQGLTVCHRRKTSAPLPFAADIICTSSEADLGMMLDWCRAQARRGWTAAEMRSVCEASV